jgi:hypothetical protein
LEQHPALNVIRRSLEHRFILPLSALRPSAEPLDRSIPGWGQWHPVIRTLDDLLTWATANVLVNEVVSNVGRCEHCGQYYVSARRERHRFCPDTDCRDRFWGSRTGAERSRKSRAIRRVRIETTEGENHVHGARRRFSRSKPARGQTPTNGGPS